MISEMNIGVQISVEGNDSGWKVLRQRILHGKSREVLPFPYIEQTPSKVPGIRELIIQEKGALKICQVPGRVIGLRIVVIDCGIEPQCKVPVDSLILTNY